MKKFGISQRETAHTNGTMEDSVVVRNQRRLSDAALFWVCTLLTVGIGLAIAYSSGIINGQNGLTNLPYRFPDWSIIVMPPVLFLHLGLALFFALRQNVYTANGRTARVWMWVFWTALFVATSIAPYFVFYNMPLASYIVATIGCALAIGTMILMYYHSTAAGIVMTIFFLVSVSTMVYLGYWAFA